MYQQLADLHARPEPFSRYTTDLIWTDPHIAGQMLRNHLDPETDAASRRAQTIEQIVSWIDRRIGLSSKRVCDLGCGPGLYATRMAQCGASVIGVDFSPSSLNHARSSAVQKGLAIDYRQADYLHGELPLEQDFVSLIYGDLCTLSPERRRTLYARVRAMLEPGGVFVFDVFTTAQFEALHETSTYARRLMDGFWAPGDYFGFLNTFLYAEETISLDRYLIVEPERRFEIYNWLQYFDPETIAREIRQAGFEVRELLDVATGEPWAPGPHELAVVACKA